MLGAHSDYIQCVGATRPWSGGAAERTVFTRDHPKAVELCLECEHPLEECNGDCAQINNLKFEIRAEKKRGAMPPNAQRDTRRSDSKLIIKRQVSNNDEEFAAAIHCVVYGVNTPGTNLDTQKILKAVETLMEREQMVLKCRYRRGMTLKETGAALGLTKSPVRPIQVNAIWKLRHSL